MINDGGASRRHVLQMGAGALIWATLGGRATRCTAGEAAASRASYGFFSVKEGNLLAEFAEALVPGAAAAGCDHFVDYHVTVAPSESLLSLRFFDVAPPYGDFYRAGLSSLARIAGNLSGAERWERVMEALAQPTLPGWQGPPPGLFYAVVRSDAIDSVYGTVEGFARLGVPYLPHIPPYKPW